MAEPVELSISPENVCYLIVKARAFDVKDAVADPDSGSNAADDDMRDVLEDHGDDPVRSEIVGFVRALNEDEQIDLVTLAWLGRGDGDAGNWQELRAEAARAHNDRTASYLLGMPLLGDFLEEGLAQLGYSCEDYEIDRL